MRGVSDVMAVVSVLLGPQPVIRAMHGCLFLDRVMPDVQAKTLMTTRSAGVELQALLLAPSRS